MSVFFYYLITTNQATPLIYVIILMKYCWWCTWSDDMAIAWCDIENNLDKHCLSWTMDRHRPQPTCMQKCPEIFTFKVVSSKYLQQSQENTEKVWEFRQYAAHVSHFLTPFSSKSLYYLDAKLHLLESLWRYILL